MAGTSSGLKTMAIISARAIGLLSSATLTPAITQTRHTARGMNGKNRNTRIPKSTPDEEGGKDVPPGKSCGEGEGDEDNLYHDKHEQQEEADFEIVVYEELELVAAHKQGEGKEDPGNP